VPTPEANHLAPGDKEGLMKLGVKNLNKDHFHDLSDYMMLSTDYHSREDGSQTSSILSNPLKEPLTDQS
jgi:hypothetical protein